MGALGRKDEYLSSGGDGGREVVTQAVGGFHWAQG